jgi:tRNA(Ile)-lysidine synthase
VPGLADLAAAFAPVAGEPALGLAVSGGADSLALMLLAQRWGQGQPVPPRLVVYTVDHGLRPEAAGEAAFVASEATRLGLAARVLRWDGIKPATGVQAAARQARYRLIGTAMRADGINTLLTAHHRDDQAETVLMRLAHGSGLAGLRGMDAMSTVEDTRVFRPLLGMPHAELAATVGAAGLVAVSDPGNTDRHYERVRWRQAMPALAELGLDAARLSQFARRAAEVDAALTLWAERSFCELAAIDAFGAAQLPLGQFSDLPTAVGVKLLGRLLETVGGQQSNRALGAIERLYARLAGDAGAGAMTMLGAAVRVRGNVLWVIREPGRDAGRGRGSVGPRETLVWDRRFRIANRSANRAVDVRMAGDITRKMAERLLGASVVAPVSAVRTAPLVSGPNGDVLALGAHAFDAELAVELVGAR